MTQNPFIKTFMVLMATLYFAMQGFTQAHAASHGDHDHSHDGIACEITLITAEEVVITPPTPVPARGILTRRLNSPVPILRSAPHSFDSRAPPLRGPPL